jgi:hypothetical protein
MSELLVSTGKRLTGAGEPARAGQNFSDHSAEPETKSAEE